jgi:hypothetical protein
MQPEDLPLEDRLRVAAMASRFFECLAVQRRFDQAVAASIERLARNPAFVERINQLLSPKGAFAEFVGDVTPASALCFRDLFFGAVD